jgi:hypothetical protein
MNIYQVTSVTVITVSSTPLKLQVHSSGLAATSGWTAPVLDPVPAPPGDPILDFNFDATPPAGISLPVLTPIQAATEVDSPTPVAAITVIARTNRITVHSSQFQPGQFTTEIAGEEHPTTLIAGEENPSTTLLGEEHVTTLIAGEENPTTQAQGEENPSTTLLGEENPTTLIAGEENPTTQAQGEEHVTTLIAGEENPSTTFVGEEHVTTFIVGEESTTKPQLDDPTGSAGGGFTTLAVGEEQGGGPFGGF